MSLISSQCAQLVNIVRGGLTGGGISAIVNRSGMVTRMNKKPVRKPRNLLINPDALHQARIEALRERKTLGEWLEELIEEKVAREEREKQRK